MQDKNFLKPGEIVLGDPGYTDQKERKRRPLLIISQNLFNQNTSLAICVGITTNKESHSYCIRLPRKEIYNGQLSSDSQIMCNRIVSIKQNQLKKIAEITPLIYEKVANKLKQDVLKL